MRAVKGMVGACVVVFALSGLGASSASAQEYPLTGLPEIGRCVKLPNATGRFSYANCVGVDKDGNDGLYEWKPGTGSAGTFKLNMTSVLFETVGFKRIKCTVGFVNGEYLNGKELKVTKVTLEGCINLAPNTSCFSNPVEKNSVIESTTPLLGKIGFLPNPKNEASPYVGVDLKGEVEAVPMLSFFCGEPTTGESWAVEGSVIGKIAKPNKMLVENTLFYKQSLGHQQYPAFKGGVTDTLSMTFSPNTDPLTKTTEAAALAAPGILVNGEPIEFKSKQR